MIKQIKEKTGFNINPVDLMNVVYGQDYFFLPRYYDVENTDIILASRYGHSGSGTLPGMAAALVRVDKVQKVKPALYRYKLKSIDVFEPFKVESREPVFTILEREYNFLEQSDDVEWLQTYLYPNIKGAYINYLNEWNVPEPTYL